MEFVFHPRISKRHPEIDLDEAEEALNRVLGGYGYRKNLNHILCIGISSKGTVFEFIYEQRKEFNLVFHVFTPPTKKFLQELKYLRR